MRAKDLGLDSTDEEQFDEGLSARERAEQERIRAGIARIRLQAMYSGIEKAAMKAGKKKVKQMADRQIKKALE